jgi:hypothetical protein
MPQGCRRLTRPRLACRSTVEADRPADAQSCPDRVWQQQRADRRRGAPLRARRCARRRRDLEPRRVLEALQRFNGRRRRFTLIGSDIRPADQAPGISAQADFRRLPYASVDVVVLDPPDTHCGHYHNNHRYGSALTAHMRHGGILELYRAGMAEALRVLRSRRALWVKCKDENDGKQYWTHTEIQNIALELGLRADDLFLLAPRPAPTRKHQRQKHALKTHSYLWIFRKVRRAS